MKSILRLLVAVFATISLATAADNKDCPVTGKGVSREVAYAKSVSFCCDKCKTKFDADPASFADKIADYKADSGKCLLNPSKPADKTKTSEVKASIGVCCDKCKSKVEANPDKYVAKVLKK